jgi:hypothetical protein
MIVFSESWQRERDERLGQYYAKDRSRRLEQLRHRLRTPFPFGSPGDANGITPHLATHARTLAALLETSGMKRGDYERASALLAALILHAPLLNAGAAVIGLLSLHPAEFVKVVETLDRQRPNAADTESA